MFSKYWGVLLYSYIVTTSMMCYKLYEFQSQGQEVQFSILGLLIGSIIVWLAFFPFLTLPLLLVAYICGNSAQHQVLGCRLLEILLGCQEDRCPITELPSRYRERWSEEVTMKQVRQALQQPFDEGFVDFSEVNTHSSTEASPDLIVTLLNSGVFEVQRMRREGVAGLKPSC